jgi:acyl dehydratase
MEQLTVKTLKPGDRLDGVVRQVTMEKMVEFEKVVWDRGKNSHSDATAARRDGLKKPLASGQNQMAFLHEMLEKNFGDGWAYGGRISVRYIHPVHAGDRIAAQGEVVEIETVDGRERLRLDVWCENQEGEKTAAGKVWTDQPSPRRSWLDGGTAQ